MNVLNITLMMLLIATILTVHLSEAKKRKKMVNLRRYEEDMEDLEELEDLLEGNENFAEELDDVEEENLGQTSTGRYNLGFKYNKIHLPFQTSSRISCAKWCTRSKGCCSYVRWNSGRTSLRDTPKGICTNWCFDKYGKYCCRFHFYGKLDISTDHL